MTAGMDVNGAADPEPGNVMEMSMRISMNAPVAPQGMAGQLSLGILTGTLKRWWVAYAMWRFERAVIALLRSMTDRELKDIGLTRPQISYAVRRSVVRLRARTRSC